MLAATAVQPDALATLLRSGANSNAVDALGSTALFYAARTDGSAGSGSSRRARARGLVIRADGLRPTMPCRMISPRSVAIWPGWARLQAAAATRPGHIRFPTASSCVQPWAMPTRHGPTSPLRPRARILRSSRPRCRAAVIRKRRPPRVSRRCMSPWPPTPVGAVRALLDAGASPVRADRRGRTPLGEAVRLGHAEIVVELLGRGVDANAPRRSRAGAACRRCRQGRRCGCNAAAREGRTHRRLSDGRTPLLIAANRGDTGMTRLLLLSGASVTAADRAGRSALWYAACRDDVELIGLLLDARPKIDAADTDGVTPAACAAARGNSAVLARLVRAGADLRQRDRSGDTLLMLPPRPARSKWCNSCWLPAARISTPRTNLAIPH